MVTPANKYECMCRTCMMKGQHFSSIFEDLEGPLKVCEMLSSLAPQLLILSSDQLPQQLCEACLNKLNIAYEFQQMCIASETHMRNALSKENALLCNAVPFVIPSNVSIEADPLLDELIKLQECIKTENQDEIEMMLAEIAYPLSTQQANIIVKEADNQAMDSIDKTDTDQTGSSTQGKAAFCNSIMHHEMGVDKIEKPASHSQRKVKLQCPHCVMSFDRPYNLKRHLTVHSEDKQFMCDICNYRFLSDNQLSRHKTSHGNSPVETGSQAPAEGYKCRECPRRFQQINSLAAHMHVHRKGKGIQIFKCNLCPKKYRKFSELTRHSHTHPENQKYKCTLCEKTFGVQSHLNEHMNKHNGLKPFVCVTCNKEYDKHSSLAAHQRTHTGEKPYLCAECGKSFHNRNNLREHLARHSGQRPHHCPECPSKFSCSSDLIKHMSTHLDHKPYQCDICNTRFTRSYSLKKHKAIHSGERPFQCDICSMTFVFRNILLKHQRTHTGEKPYKCKLCERDYAESGDLNKHMRSHLGRKTYKCEQCPEAFKYNRDLRDHIRMHYKQQQMQKKDSSAVELEAKKTDV